MTTKTAEQVKAIAVFKAALPAWHFEAYGEGCGSVAAFPPSGKGICAESWHALRQHAMITAVCGPFYCAIRKF